jgi:hypothetical protein
MRFLVGRDRGLIGAALVLLPRAVGHQVGGPDVAVALLMRLAAHPYGPESI